MSKITKLSPLMQFFLIFIASIGMIMGMGYIFMGIIGDKEIESNDISVRTREGKDLGKVKIRDFIKDLREKIDTKAYRRRRRYLSL